MVTKLEDTIYQLVKCNCEVGHDCKGHLSYEDEEQYTPNLRYCELVDLFDPKIIRCKYMSLGLGTKYCYYKNGER